MSKSSTSLLVAVVTAVLLVAVYLNRPRSYIISSATSSNTTNDPLFIIIMTSYTRENGKSPYYVRKAVQSALAQSYLNWALFVTGDNYKNDAEFRALFKDIPPPKLFLYNLPKPGERGKLTGIELWQSGGVAAMNNAIQRAVQYYNGCQTRREIYVTNLDDDDTWSKEHLHEMLQIYKRFPSVVFAWTKGYFCHQGGNPYPPLYVSQTTVNNWPHGFGGQILHSSFSFKMKIFCGFRYRAIWDFPPNFQQSRTADYDLFERIRAYIKARNLDHFHSNQATIEHLVEMRHTCAKNGTLWYPD